MVAFGIYFSNISTVTIDLSKAVDSLPFTLSVAQFCVRRGTLQESLTGPLLFDISINQKIVAKRIAIETVMQAVTILLRVQMWRVWEKFSSYSIYIHG